MDSDSFHNQCVFEVVEGLRQGLSHFSPPSRTAVIYAVRPEDPIRIHDPFNLLQGHEPRLKELYIDSSFWRENLPDTMGMRFNEPLDPDFYQNQLNGLISFGAGSKDLFFQMWYTEHHLDICSTGPTERWLEYAAAILSRNIATDMALNIGTSGYVLQEYATHAVRDHIVDQRNIKIGWDTRLRIFPILDAVLCISKTLEEGAWPRGELTFVEPAYLRYMPFLVRFPETERPSLSNYKHVRKLLLAVEDSERRLISDGANIIGIANGQMPRASIRVIFRGGHGFMMIDDDFICSFADGSFSASTRKANLVQVEELLLETNINPAMSSDMYKIIRSIVHSAGEGRHGCTLVVDYGDTPVEISGQKLDRPIDLLKPDFLDLAKSLAKVDGALHIMGDLTLHAFACLLDGHTVRGESRARGARFNSALRFSAEHANLFIVVVSADRPVSVIQGGLELTAQCEWSPASECGFVPPTLVEWLEG